MILLSISITVVRYRSNGGKEDPIISIHTPIT